MDIIVLKKMGIYKIGDNMYKKKKSYKSILFFIFISIILFILYFCINDNNKKIFLIDNLKDLSASIFQITIKKENNNINKDIIKEINSDYIKEIKELKSLLELNKINSDKKFINATVIKRSNNYWYSLVTINKGKKDNIKEGYAVINNKGLIGKVIKVNKYTSDIKLLISYNKDNYVSAGFEYEGNNYYGLISNYNPIKNEIILKNVVGELNKEKLINTNVTTSGLSDSFSSGLLIGKIKDIKKDSFGISYIIYVTPSVNFNDINIVSVVEGDKR